MNTSQRTHHDGSAYLLFLVTLLSLSACASSSGPTASGTATSTATSSGTYSTCPIVIKPSAAAWEVDDGYGTHQVVGYLGTGSPSFPTPRVIADFSSLLGLPGDYGIWSMAWSPDTRHLAVAISSTVPTATGDSTSIFPYIVDLSTGSKYRVILPHNPSVDGAPDNRILAWADKTTLLIFGGSKGDRGGTSGTTGSPTYVYNLITGAVAPLPGVTSAVSGIVRCSTLYYLEMTPLTDSGITETDVELIGPSRPFIGTAVLHHYDLHTYREVGSPFTLGSTRARQVPGVGWLINTNAPGWDVSRDGRKLAFQHTSSVVASGRLRTISTFYAANPDGTYPTPILTSTPPSPNSVALGISPDGNLVAASNLGDPMIDLYSYVPGSTFSSLYTDMMTGGAAHGYYTPALAGAVALQTGQPAWERNTSFLACQPGTAAYTTLGHNTVERYSSTTPLDATGYAPSFEDLDTGACVTAVVP